jgi:hypothetical protein
VLLANRLLLASTKQHIMFMARGSIYVVFGYQVVQAIDADIVSG